MKTLLKYFVCIFIMIPALCCAQLNSDNKTIKREKIKKVMAYNIIERNSVSSNDTDFMYYSYDREGNITDTYELLNNERRTYKSFNAYGSQTTVLSFSNDAAGHNNCDTGTYQVMKYDTNNACIYSFNLDYSYGGSRYEMNFESINTDSTFSCPNIFSNPLTKYSQKAQYVKQRYSYRNLQENELLFVRNDTIFYLRPNAEFDDSYKTFKSFSGYFEIREKTDSGFISRVYTINNDTIYYYGVTKCKTHTEYGETYFDSCYYFIFEKNVNLTYDPKTPQLEKKIKGEFVLTRAFIDEYCPVVLDEFITTHVNKDGKLNIHIDQPLENLPPYTEEFRKSFSLKSLRKEYHYVSIVEHY